MSASALIGPNGAGKSTALNMLMGMGQPGLGNIRVLGCDIREDEVEIKRRTAYVSPDMDWRWFPLAQRISLSAYIGHFILVYQLCAGIRPSSNEKLFSAG
jgi:ABC-type uncharacterized transport system ATPase subunit